MNMVRTRFGKMPLKDLTIERKRVEEFEETLMYRLWVNQSCFSLGFLSLEALFHLWVKGVFILEWERNVKRQDLQNRGGSRLDLATWLSREITIWPVVLFCPVVLQLAYCSPFGMLGTCAVSGSLKPRAIRENKPRVFVFLHTLEQSTLYLTHYPYNKPT